MTQTPNSAPRPLQVALSLGKADVDKVPHGSPEEVERIHLDFACQLFERGHVLVYGGDLKPDGELTEQLLELIAETADDAAALREHPERRLRNAVAWPIHLNYSAADLAPRHLERVFESYDPPADLGLDDAQRATFVKPDTPEHRLMWALSFGAMREQLDRTLDARVVICGRGIGSSGAVPGILEEAVCAVRGGTPLFLVGGFGGVAVPLIKAVTEGTTSVFCREAQLSHPPMAEFYAWLDETGRSSVADMAAMVTSLHAGGVEGLNNGLSREENETLFHSTDWDEVSDLLMDGLERLRAKG